MSRLELIRQRVERATERPWGVIVYRWVGNKGIGTFRLGLDVTGVVNVADEAQANADFIKFAREDIPALLAVVDAAHRYREAQRHLAETPVRITPSDLDRTRDDLDAALATLFQSVEIPEEVK